MAQPPLDWSHKGLPAAETTISLDDVGTRGWNVLREDLMLPAAVLFESALTHNSAWMRRFTALAGVKLCPHGKTTMSPQLFERQLADGAWGITAATVGHVRIYRRHGIGRIFFANQLVGRQNIAYVLDELRADPAFDFYCLVDSSAAVDILERALVAAPIGRPLQVLIELGMQGGRNGLRTDADAIDLARRIAASKHLVLRGIEAFEGIVQGKPTDEATSAVAGLLGRMVTVARHCAGESLFTGKPLLTAGGSAFFDMVAALAKTAPGEFDIVLRSGCYLAHDSEMYEKLAQTMLMRSPEAQSLGEGLKHALELWAYVQSRPEPGRVIAGLGKRDASFDVTLPKPIAWSRPSQGTRHPLDGHRTVRLDDQHAYLDVPPDSPLQVGDLIAFGISHPCTTFDRWRALYLVDDALTVTGAVHTFF